MSILQTYHGVVREGRIHITPPATLPEGSEVYVVVTGQMEGQTAVKEYVMRSPRYVEPA